MSEPGIDVFLKLLGNVDIENVGVVIDGGLTEIELHGFLDSLTLSIQDSRQYGIFKGIIFALFYRVFWG